MAHIHLADADAEEHFGKIAMVPDVRQQSMALNAKERKPVPLAIMGADSDGDKSIVALGAVVHQLDTHELVRVWDAEEKLAHTRCRFGCRKENHPHEMIPAGSLPGRDGMYIFLETEFGNGPHRIIAVRERGNVVDVTISADELIGPVAMLLPLA